MKNTLLISIFLINSSSLVLKSQDTIKTSVKTIDIIAPGGENVIAEEPVFVLVEKNARFQDGDLEKFREWVQKNLVYPPIAIENGIQGTVWVQFYINSKGKLVDSKILRGVDQSLDNEVLRVVNSSPVWEPALLKGQPVMQQFAMPVMFGLVSRKKKR
jgi:protein TonB